MILLNLPQSVVFIVVEAIVCLSLGYAIRGFISHALVQAAKEAKEYLDYAKADVNEAVDQVEKKL